MAVKEQNFLKAIEKIKVSEKKVNFDQTVDLIINLKDFDVRRESFNLFVKVPHKIKDKNIAGFFEKDSKLIDTVRKDSFGRYKEKKDMRKLIKKYDFFIANAKLMPAIATSFGRFLGPAGKMPSPQLGILPSEDETMIQAIIKKINSTARIKVKEPSIKIAIGKQSMENNSLAENALAIYNQVIETLPRHIDNIRNIKIKLTMGNPEKVEL